MHFRLWIFLIQNLAGVTTIDIRRILLRDIAFLRKFSL